MRKLTRKRYIKLKMAEGLSRNEAVQNAREIVEEGLSYQEDYEYDAECPHLTPAQAINMIEALTNGLSRDFEAIARAFESLAAAAAAASARMAFDNNATKTALEAIIKEAMT